MSGHVCPLLHTPPPRVPDLSRHGLHAAVWPRGPSPASPASCSALHISPPSPFSHPSTSQPHPCLASDIRQGGASSGWYGRRPQPLLIARQAVCFSDSSLRSPLHPEVLHDLHPHRLLRPHSSSVSADAPPGSLPCTPTSPTVTCRPRALHSRLSFPDDGLESSPSC